MRFDILDRPDFSVIRIVFQNAGEQILCEPEAMVAKDTSVKMSTSTQGGLWRSFKRKLFGGEALFQNTFTSSKPGETLWLAPGPEGDVENLNLKEGTTVYLQSGAYLASAPTVSVDAKWEGTKGFFAGNGFFLLRCSGTGPLFFNCYGGLHAVDIGEEGYICDTNHVVAFTEGVQYKIKRPGGLKSFFFSGEGLVCRFSGSGRLWISTRNHSSLGSFLKGFRPASRG